MHAQCIRARYQKLPGVYPNAAGKIVSKAPYKSKEDMCAAPQFSSSRGTGVLGSVETAKGSMWLD